MLVTITFDPANPSREGSTVELSDGEARAAIHTGRAVPAAQPEPQQPQQQPAVAKQPPPQPDEAQPGPPPQSASKADWVTWAEQEGADRGDAEDMTKDDLIEMFGGHTER